MDKDIKKLKEFQSWFGKFIKKGYGRKCPDFVWSCHSCHAYFVKDLLDGFIDDTIETERWVEKQSKKMKK